MSDLRAAAPNRRICPRRVPRHRVRAELLKGTMGLGKNLARGLLDVSETGARLLINSEVASKQEVELNLQGAGHVRPVRIFAEVIWCVPVAENEWQVGVRFQNRLDYGELIRLVG